MKFNFYNKTTIEENPIKVFEILYYKSEKWTTISMSKTQKIFPSLNTLFRKNDLLHYALKLTFYIYFLKHNIFQNITALFLLSFFVIIDWSKMLQNKTHETPFIYI
jgi:hypothetical protein